MLSSDKRQKDQELLSRVEYIRETLSISEVLEALGVDYSTGKGKILCLFPAHAEKTGSMKVYEDTNSVHCFGCGRSGDVIEIVRVLAGRDGQRVSLEHAIRWFQRNFELKFQTSSKTLKQRLGSRIKRWRETTSEPLDSHRVLDRVLATRDSVQLTLGREVVLALSYLEDYVWAEQDRPGTDLGEWERWATSFFRGTYRRSAESLTEPTVTPALRDARPLRSDPNPVDCTSLLLGT